MAPQTPVILNVYDLVDANQYTSYFGFGIYHSGVQLGNEEFSFANGGGVFSSTPKQAPGATFRESITIGMFTGTTMEAQRLAYSLCPEFRGNSYNLFTKNCNAYSEALCQLLVKKSIPAYVNRAAYLGSFFSCLIPTETVSQAPVGHPDASAFSSSSSTRLMSSRRSDIIYGAFAGDGMALGSGNSSSTTTQPSSLADRREKIRMATLRRYEEKNTQ